MTFIASCDEVPLGIGRSARTVLGYPVVVMWLYDVVRDEWKVRADCAARHMSAWGKPVPATNAHLQRSIASVLALLRRGIRQAERRR